MQYQKNEDIKLSSSEKVFSGAINELSYIFPIINPQDIFDIDFLNYELEVVDKNYIIKINLKTKSDEKITNYFIKNKKEIFLFQDKNKSWTAQIKKLKPISQKKVSQNLVVDELKDLSTKIDIYDAKDTENIISDPLNKVIMINFKSKEISSINTFIYDFETKQTNWLWSQLKFIKVSNGKIDFSGKLVQSK